MYKVRKGAKGTYRNTRYVQRYVPLKKGTEVLTEIVQVRSGLVGDTSGIIHILGYVVGRYHTSLLKGSREILTYRGSR